MWRRRHVIRARFWPSGVTGSQDDYLLRSGFHLMSGTLFVGKMIGIRVPAVLGIAGKRRRAGVLVTEEV